MALLHEKITKSIIGAFYEVYNVLGFGFLESSYVKALESELVTRGHSVAREVSFPVIYKGQNLGTQRIDMIVDGKVIVETKSTYDLHPSARRQVFNYLRATNLDVGLLLHFGPKAAFYRQVRSFPLNKDPIDPDDPSDPEEPTALDHNS